MIKLKAKDSEVVATPLGLGNISKEFSVDNMKKTLLNGFWFWNVYDFSVDYDAMAVYDISDIHRYLMKKNAVVQNVCVFKENIFLQEYFLVAMH